MTHVDVVAKVRDILNEHGGSDGLGVAEDRVLLEDYICSAIPDAVVLLAQRGYRVNECKIDVDLSKFTQIPTDFISLVSLKITGWEKEVTKLTERDSPEFIMAQNNYTSPGKHNPIVYFSPYGNISFLPKTNYSNVETMCYNGTYKETVGLNALPKEATAVCYMAAALVMGMFGDDDAKQRLSDIATNMLQ